MRKTDADERRYRFHSLLIVGTETALDGEKSLSLGCWQHLGLPARPPFRN